jgi:pentapeptide MXKDX repeat protein
MKKRLIMLALVSAFGLQEFAFGMQQDTTRKKKTHQRDTLKRDTVKKDTLKKIKP